MYKNGEETGEVAGNVAEANETGSEVAATPLGPEWAILGAQIKRCPVEFGQMLRDAREALKKTQYDVAREMTNRMVKQFGKVGAFEQNMVSRWERGNIGERRKDERTATEAKPFFDYFNLDVTDVTEKLKAVVSPSLPPTVEKEQKAAGLAEHDATLLDMLVTSLTTKATITRNQLEDKFLAQVGIEIDFASMLTAGLLKLPPEQQTATLAKMLTEVRKAK